MDIFIMYNNNLRLKSVWVCVRKLEIERGRVKEDLGIEKEVYVYSYMGSFL